MDAAASASFGDRLAGARGATTGDDGGRAAAGALCGDCGGIPAMALGGGGRHGFIPGRREMPAAKTTAPRTNASVNGDKGLLEMCFSGPDHLPGNQSRPSLVRPITTGFGSAV